MKNTKFWQVFVETKLEFCKVIVITWLEKKSGDHWQPEMNWHHEEVPLLHIQKAKAVLLSLSTKVVDSLTSSSLKMPW